MVLAAVFLVVVGSATAWLAGLGPGHDSGSQTSSWRTGWALSLAHSGVLDGTDLTCRLIARVAITGSQVRFRLVNYPATTPVTFSHLTVGIRTVGLAIDPASEREVTVGGSARVTLAPDGDVLTDPVELPLQRGQDLALSIAVSSGVSSPWHYWSPQKSGCTEVGAGDVAADTSGSRFTKDSEIRWLSEVQVRAQTPVTTVVAYGDSLTDGLFLPVDTLGRWTDLLQDETDGRLVVLNYGVSGDQATGPIAGQLPRRLTTDVLAPAGVSAMVVQLGSNDIAAGVSAATIVEQYRRIAAKVAAAGETLIVATVPARNDDLPKGAERQRLLLNQALREFPAQVKGSIVADLDAVLTDPHTGTFDARYDIGDHVHPNQAGVAVIARVMRDALRKVPGSVAAAVS